MISAPTLASTISRCSLAMRASRSAGAIGLDAAVSGFRSGGAAQARRGSRAAAGARARKLRRSIGSPSIISDLLADLDRGAAAGADHGGQQSIARRLARALLDGGVAVRQ